MFLHRVAAAVVAVLVAAVPLQSQDTAATAGADQTYAQIPQWGEAGEQKLQAGDARGAIAEFRRAFEGSRELRRQYPDEPAYTENAYYYLGRLGVAFAAAGEYENAAQMMEPSARGYVEFASQFPSAENNEKAAIALGRLAWYQVLTRKGAEAVRSAQQALELDPSLTVVRINLAHAHLVSGDAAEAEKLYLQDRDAVSEDGRAFRDIILEDFDEMEKAGIRNDTIARVRQALGGNAQQTGRSGSRRQTDVFFWLFIVGIVAFIAAIFAVVIYFDRKRSQKMEAAATALGFAFRRKPLQQDKALVGGSALQSMGHGHRFRNIIEIPEREGARCTLFDFTYVVGHGKNSKTYTQTVTRVESPKLNLPAFQLRPEGVLLKLAQSLGLRDFDFTEWPVFSKTYQLRGEDEAAVRAVFTPRVLSYCEQNRGLWISGNGNFLWIHRERRRVKPDELATFLASSLEVATLFLEPGAPASTPPPASQPPPLPPPPLPA